MNIDGHIFVEPYENTYDVFKTHCKICGWRLSVMLEEINNPSILEDILKFYLDGSKYGDIMLENLR